MNDIYVIRNQRNGKTYIGSAIDVKKRWREHKRTLRKGTHHARHLQRAWNKYGEDSFVFEIVEANISAETLLQREQTHIDNCPRNLLYNTSPYVRNGFRGYQHTEETKRKISQAHIGRKRPPETGQRISRALRGVKKPHRGVPHTEETKQKLRQYRGEKASFYGRQHRATTKEKMRQRHLGRKRPHAVRVAMSTGRDKKLNWGIVDLIRTYYAKGARARDLANIFHVSVSLIYRIVWRQCWKPELRP